MTEFTISLAPALCCRRLSCDTFGHILRMEKVKPMSIYSLYEPPTGKRPSGRPRRSFSRQAQEWIDPNNYFSKKKKKKKTSRGREDNNYMSEDDIVRTAQDRASWRRLTVDCFLGPVHTYMDIFKNGDYFFSVLKKKIRVYT